MHCESVVGTVPWLVQKLGPENTVVLLDEVVLIKKHISHFGPQLLVGYI